MSEPYLIAHKVRGEPAFDVATRMTCPLCIGEGQRYELMTGCHECDSLGYWWIIPTSGHRAYPWWFTELMNLACENDSVNDQRDWPCIADAVPPMPPDLPDHYQHLAAPRFSLTEALGLKPKPLPPIIRRL